MKIETAKKIYNACDPWYKVVLEDEFGKENLVNRDFSDIQTIEEAIKEAGYSLDYVTLRGEETVDEWAYRMLKVVAKALNGEWTPDWSNTSQAKWYNYFRVLPSGAGFSYSLAHNDHVEYTRLGSRLYFESQKKAQHAAKYFENLYIKYLLINK